jgi:hypothetical protein
LVSVLTSPEQHGAHKIQNSMAKEKSNFTAVES